MGAALEVISGFTTAAGAAFTGLTMATGNTLAIRNARLDAKVLLCNLWTDHQVAGEVRVRSPKLHDNVRGIHIRTVISECKPLLPLPSGQRLVPQDVLVVEQTGSAVGGDIETASLLLYYEDLPGADARFVGKAECVDRMAQLLTITTTHAPGAVGGYSGQVALNSTDDLLKANTDYALIGYHVDVECATVRWQGADTGNLGVGGPGDELGRDYTAEWFMDLSQKYGLPMIPVFNSANKAGILVDIAQDENAATVRLTSILAELIPRAGSAGAYQPSR